MPLIRVEMFPGRSREQKREIAKALTDAFVGVTGAKPESVSIIMSDVAKEDWAKAGELMIDKFPD